MRKNMLRIVSCAMLLMGIIVVCNVDFITATVDKIKPPEGGTEITGLTTRAGEIWNTVKLIIQVVSLGIFVFTGVKYMFVAAEQKADLKKGLVMTFIGVALVYGLTFVVDFVQDIANELF